MKAEGKKYPTTIAADIIEKMVGPQQFFPSEAERTDEVGLATGR